ncbi:hypothetical protein [Methylomonas sp. AM2-LC]|uniref:hypothetical protein n=1 Tax=Methylomonas sp. AM2-LC TaxID=3153301 RepID=UPI003263D5B9
MATQYLQAAKRPTLNKQIQVAERQLVQQKQSVMSVSSSLLQQLRQRMTAPTTLSLAIAVGYICAEMTECQTRMLAGKQQKTGHSFNSVINTTQHCLTLLHEMYSALPLILIIKSYFATKSINDDPATISKEAPLSSTTDGRNNE